mmetsp:Transcript_39480/g.114304  ORF Transcript_39480/g.114304 Transcript_39480/m.114304 type:complete len:265 (+) Transcript_39480:1684-2478(+)
MGSATRSTPATRSRYNSSTAASASSFPASTPPGAARRSKAVAASGAIVACASFPAGMRRKAVVTGAATLRRSEQLIAARRTSLPKHFAAAAASMSRTASAALSERRMIAPRAPEVRLTFRCSANVRTIMASSSASAAAHSTRRTSIAHGVIRPDLDITSSSRGIASLSRAKRDNFERSWPCAADGDTDFHGLASAGTRASAASKSPSCKAPRVANTVKVDGKPLEKSASASAKTSPNTSVAFAAKQLRSNASYKPTPAGNPNMR